jgi:hypothetical protein
MNKIGNKINPKRKKSGLKSKHNPNKKNEITIFLNCLFSIYLNRNKSENTKAVNEYTIEYE